MATATAIRWGVLVIWNTGTSFNGPPMEGRRRADGKKRIRRERDNVNGIHWEHQIWPPKTDWKNGCGWGKGK
jgi:hypothetical protein